MIPAIRATASTSPLAAAWLRMASAASRDILIRPSAAVSRTLTCLADTSTMCAAPFSSRWVSLLIARQPQRKPHWRHATNYVAGPPEYPDRAQISRHRQAQQYAHHYRPGVKTLVPTARAGSRYRPQTPPGAAAQGHHRTPHRPARLARAWPPERWTCCDADKP